MVNLLLLGTAVKKKDEIRIVYDYVHYVIAKDILYIYIICMYMYICIDICTYIDLYKYILYIYIYINKYNLLNTQII